MTEIAPARPVSSGVQGVVIPVADVGRARDWYRDVLGFDVGEIIGGHLCCIGMAEGPDLLLDSTLVPGNEPGTGGRIEKGAYPVVMLRTEDIRQAAEALEGRGVELVAYGGQIVQNGHWFNFRDCEGNLVMMCDPVHRD